MKWIERLLWVFAAAALGLVAFVFADARIHQTRLSRAFDDARAAGPLTAGVLEKAEAAEPSSLNPPAVSRPHVGRLEIPRLHISVMLLDGVDSRTLRRGLGHIPGTAWPGEPGNAGIAGHRDTFFRGLSGIRKHDRITVETPGGDYQYIVDSIRIVDPAAVGVLKDAGHPVLTLVTCYPFYFVGPAPKRFVVEASLQESRAQE